MNKAMIIGNLGADPEARFTQSGTQVVNFTVATSERWTDKDGNKKKTTEWHKVVAWGALAGICEKYLTKGSKVYIEGKIQTRKWQDQEGRERYTTEINAKEMEMLGSQPKTMQDNAGNGYSPAGPTGDDSLPF